MERASPTTKLPTMLVGLAALDPTLRPDALQNLQSAPMVRAVTSLPERAHGGDRGRRGLRQEPPLDHAPEAGDDDVVGVGWVERSEPHHETSDDAGGARCARPTLRPDALQNLQSAPDGASRHFLARAAHGGDRSRRRLRQEPPLDHAPRLETTM